MNNAFVNLLVRWLVLAIGVILSTRLVPGISCSDGPTLVAVVLLLSLFNAVLKPLLMLFALPFIILTMGVGIWLINSLIFYGVGRLVDGFQVAGFGSAMLGALIVSITSLVMNRLLGPPGPPASRSSRPPRAGPEKRDEVIDI